MENNFKSGLDVIYLISCALHGIIPDEKIVTEMDLEAVYAQAKRHMMLSVTCMALEKYADKLDAELMKKWRTAVDRTELSSFLYSVEREKLYRFMDENEIAYLPLKGIILQNIYPKPAMRQMADNDILIDINKRDLVRDYMVNCGYDTEQFGKSSHDVYIKASLFNFEMHVYLVTESLNPDIYNYYLDIWQRLERVDKDKYKYSFKKEDFYIFIIVHAYKHFCYGGIGLKPLTDIFVYLRKYGEELNRQYLDDEFTKLELSVFEQNMRHLSETVFANAICEKNSADGLNDEETKLLKFFIDSGNFGNKDVLYKALIERFADGEGKITKGSKIRYLLSRLFPTGIYIKENYPFFYKYKFLIPILWPYRILSRLIKNPKHVKHIKKELEFLNKQNKSD